MTRICSKANQLNRRQMNGDILALNYYEDTAIVLATVEDLFDSLINICYSRYMDKVTLR